MSLQWTKAGDRCVTSGDYTVTRFNSLGGRDCYVAYRRAEAIIEPQFFVRENAGERKAAYDACIHACELHAEGGA